MSTAEGQRSVSVALVSWNGLEHLKLCLPALEDQRDPGVPWEILLFDNGSRDGTASWVRAHHPRVRLIESPVNQGFCAANNRLAAEARGEWLALLNNDTRPEPGWLAALVGAAREAPPDVAAISGLILDWEGERLDFGRGVMTFDGHAFQVDFRRPLPRARVPAEGEELLFACGGNALLRRASFLAAGGFAEEFFAYLEDVDLGWRLWAGGERVLAAPRARIRHRSSATSDRLGSFNRGFLFERNAFLTACRNYDGDHWPRLLPVVLLTFLARTQTYLEHNNPGGALLAVDPYAAVSPEAGPGALAPAPRPRVTPTHLWRRWRELGGAEFLRRGLRRTLGRPAPSAPSPPPAPVLTDPRTVAQLRAQGYLLRHLDAAAEGRTRIQARRRRPDREIFERFPLYLVPTYPGDRELFSSPGFRSWLPADLPLVEETLEGLMELGGP